MLNWILSLSKLSYGSYFRGLGYDYGEYSISAVLQVAVGDIGLKYSIEKHMELLSLQNYFF